AQRCGVRSALHRFVRRSLAPESIPNITRPGGSASPSPQLVVGCAPVNDGTPRDLQPRAAPLEHVSALDGVRGIAIALVLVYHFDVPGLRGGFLGVDLFFVLSGFLITTLLLDEHRANARIDLVSFWYRRGRRLLPALFLLIAVVVVVAAWATPIEKGELRWDLLASIGYA